MVYKRKGRRVEGVEGSGMIRVGGNVNENVEKGRNKQEER